MAIGGILVGMRGVMIFVFLWAFLGNCYADLSKIHAPNNDLIGVDNYMLPSDTLVLMNHLLIDIQLDYDFAVESNDIPAIIQALHQKALVYLKLNDLESANNYAWRLFNLSDKYDLEEGRMYSYALLVRINQAEGNNVKVSFFQNKYNAVVDDFDANFMINPIVIGVLPEDIKAEEESFSKTITPEKKQVQDTDVRPEFEAGFYWNNQYGLVIFCVGLVLFAFLFFGSNRNPNPQLMIANKAISPISMIEPSSQVIAKKKDPELKLVEVKTFQKNSNQEKVSVINKTKSMTEVGGNSAFKLGEESSKVSNELTADLIRSKRGADFYQKAEIQQAPLWVSGIEHHLKGMNAYNGIRFDFNYSGDFSNVSEKTQNIITNFMTSLAETLVDASNIQSVSSQLVNSNEGLVAMLVARPLVSSRPVLDVITISSIRKVFSGSSKYRVSTHNVPGGLLKVVLKHSVKEYNLVS